MLRTTALVLVARSLSAGFALFLRDAAAQDVPEGPNVKNGWERHPTPEYEKSAEDYSTSYGGITMTFTFEGGDLTGVLQGSRAGHGMNWGMTHAGKTKHTYTWVGDGSHSALVLRGEGTTGASASGKSNAPRFTFTNSSARSWHASNTLIAFSGRQIGDDPFAIENLPDPNSIVVYEDENNYATEVVTESQAYVWVEVDVEYQDPALIVPPIPGRPYPMDPPEIYGAGTYSFTLKANANQFDTNWE